MTGRSGAARDARAAAMRALVARLGAPSERSLSLMEWAVRVPEPKTGPLDFKLFPFQRELYEAGADEREAVVMKSTQVGVSAWAARWALHEADVHGRTGLYICPTSGDVHDFCAARIKPIIGGSDYLRARQARSVPNNVGLIGIGGGVVYFRGSESRRGLDSVDADHVVFDEYDTLVHENIPDAERRVSGPMSAGLIRRVGVPTVPNWGIARLYDQSDRRRWQVKCQACGHWQPLDFEANVDTVRALRVCARCRKRLDVSIGEWVADFPDRDVRGYHMTRLIAPTADIPAIIAASTQRAGFERQAFFNKDLAVAWAPEEGRLSLAVIAAAQSLGGFAMLAGYSGDGLVTMGVDVASTRALNVRISEHVADGRKRGIYIGAVNDFDALATLMDRFGVHMAAIDHLPEGRLARAFAERFPGRAFLVAYDTSPRPRTPDVLKVDLPMRFATVRRLEAIDAMTESLRAQRNLLPGDLPDEYVDHLQALVRTVEEDPFGNQRATYRSTGPDDYAQAEVYDVVAEALWGYQQQVAEIERETFSVLDDHLDFERSRLADYDDDGWHYSPGPPEPDLEDLLEW